MSIHKHSMTHT